MNKKTKIRKEMKMVELGEVFERIKNGKSIKQFGTNGLPISRIETISNGEVDWERVGYADIDNLSIYEDYVLQNGDILMSHINSWDHLGKSALYKGIDGRKMIHGMNLLCLRVDAQKAIPQFCKYFFTTKFFKSQLSKISNQSVNQSSFSVSKLKSLQIPLPPLPVQRRIAAILDAADEHRRKTQALIDKYDELAQSVFLEMFGDPVRNEKDWKIMKLSEVCSKITDGTHHSPPLQESGFPYVTAKHVRPFYLDFHSKPTFISQKHHEDIYKRCDPEVGDVLYIKDGATTGIACINTFDEPISLLSSLALLKVGPQLKNYYLCFWLNDNRVKQKLISEFMSGAAIKRFTLKKINSFMIPVPDMVLQNNFVEIIQNIEKQKKLTLKNSIQSNTLFQSLLQRAFRGELVTEEEEVVE